MKKPIKLKNFGKEKFGSSLPKAAAVITSIKMNPNVHEVPRKQSSEDITVGAEEVLEVFHRSTIQMDVFLDEKSVDKAPITQEGRTIYLEEKDYEAIQSIIAKYI